VLTRFPLYLPWSLNVPIMDLLLPRQRLQLAAEQYSKSISKKKLSPALNESEKLLPREAFGITMVRHSEDFADDSLLGNHDIVLAFCLFLAHGEYGRTSACNLWTCIL